MPGGRHSIKPRCWGSLAGPESSRKLLFGGLKHHSFCSNPNEGRGMPGGRHSIKHRSICSNPNEGRGFPGLKHIRRARVIGETIFWGSKKSIRFAVNLMKGQDYRGLEIQSKMVGFARSLMKG